MESVGRFRSDMPLGRAGIGESEKMKKVKKSTEVVCNCFIVSPNKEELSKSPPVV